jgi:hypothetical protein
MGRKITNFWMLWWFLSPIILLSSFLLIGSIAGIIEGILRGFIPEIIISVMLAIFGLYGFYIVYNGVSIPEPRNLRDDEGEIQ